MKIGVARKWKTYESKVWIFWSEVLFVKRERERDGRLGHRKPGYDMG